MFKMPTIGITGSVGKTTTTLFAEYVFAEKYNVFVSGPGGKNYNIPTAITKAMIGRYGPQYDMHIQECGGGRSRLVEEAAELLHVDAFGITGINEYHHTDAYNGTEDLIADKTSFDRHSDENAIGVINIDDEILRNYEFSRKIITYGIKDKEADYFAENIEQSGKWLTFDITGNGETVPIRIQIIGKHNAYNALMIFALAKYYGLSNESIQRGFEKYKGGDIRQSIREVAGRILYVDCFNVCADSIKSCCAAMKDINLEKGARRIAVINGENALGDKHYSINYKTGQDLAEYKHIDRFIFLGLNEHANEKELNHYGDGKAVFDGAESTIDKRKISFVDDLEELATILREETFRGDLILFKGIFRLPLFAAIDMAFGTSYLMYNPNFKGKTVSDKNYAAGSYEYLENEANIFRVKTDSLNPIIPKRIGTCRIYRIGKGVFKGRDIESIDFGRGVKTIGAYAFANCKKLTELKMTRNVRFIEENAFEGCIGLSSVYMNGVEHISREAFKDCKNLGLVFLPDSVKTIEEDAFLNCLSVLFSVEEGTYAYQWAVEKGYKYIIR